MGKLAGKFVALDERRAGLKDMLEDIQKERDEVEKRLMELMSECGTESMKQAGQTIFFRRQIWPHVPDGRRPDLLAKLKAHGDTKFLVKENANASQLAAWVRELPRDPANDLPKIPRRLAGLLEASERISLQTRKA